MTQNFYPPDFLYITKSCFLKCRSQERIKQLNKNNYILNTHHIPLSSIKNVDNFFSDMELDMMEMNRKK